MQDLTKLVIAILLLALLPAQARAQSEDVAAGDFFDDTPVVLTASRLSKPLMESPSSVSIIGRQLIESSGAREIADLFRLVPGFVVGYHSGHAPAVSYHGLGQEFSRNMQVLVDGRSVFIPSFGGIPWSNLPLLVEDIERIEIIRGPNAVTYGANAFLATINIITRDASEDQGSYYSVSLSDNANPDIEDAYLRIGNHFENLDWRLSLGAINDEGFDNINDSKRIGKANFRMDLHTRDNHAFSIQFGSSNSMAGRGFPQSPDTQTDIERTEEATNRYLNIFWEKDWDKGTSSLRLTNTRQEVTDNYDPGPFDFGVFTGVTTYIDFDRVSDRTDLEFIQSNDIDSNLRIVYGGSLRQDKVRSVFLLNQTGFQTVDTDRLFGALEWRINPDWLLDLGLMVEESDLTDRELSPRVSLIRSFGNRHALRFVASVASRNPILVESEGETEFVADFPFFGTVVVPTLLGNDDIEPEQIKSFEIGFRSQFENDVESDIKLFRYEIEDHILNSSTPVDPGFPLPVLDVPTVINDEKTMVTGVELALDLSPAGNLDIHSGFSVVNIDADLDLIEDSYPDFTGFISGEYRFNEKHRLSASYYYLDNIGWLDSQRDTAVARRLDLRYVYFLGNETRIEIIGQNLLEDYEDYESENIHDQVVYLRLSGEF